MLSITLWDETQTGKTLDLVVRHIGFFHAQGTAVVFVRVNKLPQSILNWICSNKIEIHTWFGFEEMRLFIPTNLISDITTHIGEIPLYVPEAH